MGIAISKFKKFGYQNLADVSEKADALYLILCSTRILFCRGWYVWASTIYQTALTLYKNYSEMWLLNQVGAEQTVIQDHYFHIDSEIQWTFTEELELAQKYETTANMDEPEKFVWHMSKVPKLKARLKCLEVIATWEDKRTKLEETINTGKPFGVSMKVSIILRTILSQWIMLAMKYWIVKECASSLWITFFLLATLWMLVRRRIWVGWACDDTTFSIYYLSRNDEQSPRNKSFWYFKAEWNQSGKRSEGYYARLLDRSCRRAWVSPVQICTACLFGKVRFSVIIRPEVLELDKDFKALQWALNINEDKIQTQWNEVRTFWKISCAYRCYNSLPHVAAVTERSWLFTNTRRKRQASWTRTR